MGDWFQTIVDKDASLEEARQLAPRIRDWLIEEGIIESRTTDCVLGGEGHPPGPNADQATEEYYDWFKQLWTNGLKIVVGRTVFHSGQGGLNLICPKCQTRYEHENNAFFAEWNRALLEWYETRGAGPLQCPTCSHTESVVDWGYDPPWGFGNLGFEFWNWPRLKKTFVAEVAQRLGHRIIFVADKF